MGRGLQEQQWWVWEVTTQTRQLRILFQQQWHGPCFLEATIHHRRACCTRKRDDLIVHKHLLVQFPFWGVHSILAGLQLIYTAKSNCDPEAAAGGALCGTAHQRVFSETKAQRELLPKFIFLITLIG